MAKMKGPKKTNRYPEEFKIKAVQLADHDSIRHSSYPMHRPQRPHR